MTQEDEDQDPLERLLLDKNSINREKLTEALEDRIGIDQDSADPVYRAGWQNLSNKKKTTYFLLYRKAVVALGMEKEENEGMSSREISDETGVNYDTLRSILSRAEYIEKDEEKGGYIIPGHSLDRAIEVVEDE
ncbi:MAG: hypothetical protein H8Z69_01745 [Nanohaloarchaea archaeon]|nr:hypothetical protein [Candidatus Nanohaloarchaea archaeon]